MVYSNGCDFWCDIGESDGVSMWPIKMGEILGAILMNQVGYLIDPVKWLGL